MWMVVIVMPQILDTIWLSMFISYVLEFSLNFTGMIFILFYKLISNVANNVFYCYLYVYRA